MRQSDLVHGASAKLCSSSGREVLLEAGSRAGLGGTQPNIMAEESRGLPWLNLDICSASS